MKRTVSGLLLIAGSAAFLFAQDTRELVAALQEIPTEHPLPEEVLSATNSVSAEKEIASEVPVVEAAAETNIPPVAVAAVKGNEPNAAAEEVPVEVVVLEQEEPSTVEAVPAAADEAVVVDVAAEVAPVPAAADSDVAASSDAVVVEVDVQPAEDVVVVEVAPVDEAAVTELAVEAGPAEATTDEIAITDDAAAGAEILGGRISLSLKDVGLQDVIRLFSRLSNANIITPDFGEEVAAKRVDVNLHDVEWKPALQAILESHGMELYEKIPGTEVYSVRTKSADAPDPMDVKSFKLNYATVADVQSLIEGLVPEAGSVAVFPARNAIVIKSTAANLLEIQKLIGAVDLPRQQVFIEAKFMELTDSASEKLGIDWQVLGGYNAGFTGISKSYKDGYSRNTSRFSVTDDLGGRYIPWTGTNGNEKAIFEAPEYVENPDLEMYERFANPANIYSTHEAVARVASAVLGADDFNVVLAALRDNNGVKIVSNPKVIVANEETASILIGQREPNIRQSTTQAENADAVTTYQLDAQQPYFEYGVRLEVTPTVNTAENISVNINPTLSSKVEDKIAGDNSYPVTEEKTITTTFSLKSGQTAAIGGLTQMTDRAIDRKVPVLGSIPFLGRLFSYSSKENTQAETIIFVTVALANPDHIDMETGLPTDSRLAQRYDVTSTANRQIHARKLELLKLAEQRRLEEELQKLEEVEKQAAAEK